MSGDERPFWLTEDCPAWCENRHEDIDPVGERQHRGVALAVLLTQHQGHQGWTPRLSVRLEQATRETGPRVLMSYGTRIAAELTVEECEQLGANLLALARTAGGTP